MAVLNSNVLILNRSYLPVHVTSVRRAFSLLYQGIARAVDEQYQTFDFDTWSRLAVARDMEAIGTPGGMIRIPRVLVLVTFDRLPRRHVRFSRLNLMSRDKFQCQYCGIKPVKGDLNLDHVIPRAQGGRSTWENVVTSCVNCNRRKGGRTPKQARMKLRSKPKRPRWTPLMNLVSSNMRYKEWKPFLSVVDASYWNTELVE